MGSLMAGQGLTRGCSSGISTALDLGGLRPATASHVAQDGAGHWRRPGLVQSKQGKSLRRLEGAASGSRRLGGKVSPRRESLDMLDTRDALHRPTGSLTAAEVRAAALTDQSATQEKTPAPERRRLEIAGASDFSGLSTVTLESTSGTSRLELSEAQKAVEEALRVKAEMGRQDTNLLSTNEHRAWVTAGAAALVGMLVKAGLAVHDGDSLLTAGIAMLAAYILSDLGTGIYHWGVDNYGDARTPIFGPQIDAFQGHHQRPWTITKRQFANNLHALTRPASFVLLPFLLAPNSAALDAFVGVFMACVVFSQQFHAWSHTPKTLLPPLVVALQDSGLLVGRKMHGAHHKPPYNVNYCIVSGICNKLLDGSGLLRWMEAQILQRWGVAPRSWGETAPEWLEVSYYEDGRPEDEASQ